MSVQQIYDRAEHLGLAVSAAKAAKAQLPYWFNIVGTANVNSRGKDPFFPFFSGISTNIAYYGGLTESIRVSAASPQLADKPFAIKRDLNYRNSGNPPRFQAMRDLLIKKYGTPLVERSNGYEDFITMLWVDKDQQRAAKCGTAMANARDLRSEWFCDRYLQVFVDKQTVTELDHSKVEVVIGIEAHLVDLKAARDAVENVMKKKDANRPKVDF